MPDILAHVVITEKLCDAHSVILGSTLDDFAGMYADSTGNSANLDAITSRELLYGRLIHKLTDMSFGQLELKKELVRCTLVDIAESKCLALRETAATRVYGLVAIDLVFARLLIEDPQLADVCSRFTSFVLSESLLQLDGGGCSSNLPKLIKGYFGEGIRPDFGDPVMISTILQRRVAERAEKRNRKLLYFPPEVIPEGAQIIAKQIDRVRPHAQRLLEMTVEEVRARMKLNSMFEEHNSQ